MQVQDDWTAAARHAESKRDIAQQGRPIVRRRHIDKIRASRANTHLHPEQIPRSAKHLVHWLPRSGSPPAHRRISLSRLTIDICPGAQETRCVADATPVSYTHLRAHGLGMISYAV